MAIHLQRELDKLKKKLLSVGALVEENVRNSVDIINNYSDEKLQKIRMNDDKIDEYEVDVEEDCLKILALHQPVAVDLRFIVAVLKINNDLERASDQAVNIAKHSKHANTKSKDGVEFDFSDMGKKAQMMLKNSLDALVNFDYDLAQSVRKADDEVDDIHKEMYKILEEKFMKCSGDAGYMMNIMQISRNLERIADLATNIAEDVIYMIEGKIVRHRHTI
ncbi:MAG: phosphate signaling complex protein PhoU [Acidobacteria bacterium]|nr:phosphate signaling complex protein PhoU [Acidobacteriota bacterium]